MTQPKLESPSAVVYFYQHQRTIPFSSKPYRQLMLLILNLLGQNNCVVSIVFCSKKKITRLNLAHRQLAEPTDVLSFTSNQVDETGKKYLGDIFICPQVAHENAIQCKEKFSKEMIILHIHGLLHLLGFDHECDHGEMLLLQKKLIRQLKTDSKET